MLDVFKDLLKRTNKALTQKQIEKAIRKQSKQMVVLNRGQLDDGLDNDDDSLGVYRDFSYKNRLEPVDLKLSGDFHKSIKVEIENDKIIIIATDEKTDMLKDRYGDDILGLGEFGQDKVREKVEENLLDQLKKDWL